MRADKSKSRPPRPITGTDSGSPFVHRFQTTDHHYIYDVNTNRILQVDRVVWDILGLGIGWSCLEDLESRLDEHDSEAVRAAVEKCEWLQRELGVFSSFRPEGMAGYDPYGTDKRLYERGLEQLTIELTQACNLRCRYCVYSELYPLERGYASKTIEWEVARKAIDYFLARVADTELPFIGFYGGEPLLEFGLLRRCVEYALEVRKGAPLDFTVTTNGTLITSEMLAYLVKRSVKLMISLDGPPRCHDENRVFRNGQPSSESVFRALEMIKDVNKAYCEEYVSIASTLAPNTDPIAFYEFFEKQPYLLGTGGLNVGSIREDGSNCGEENRPSLEWQQSMEALRWKYYEALALGEEAPNPFLERLFQDHFLRIYRRGIFQRLPDWIGLNGCCVPGVRKLYVDCDGRFHLCERINNTMPIGDVEQGIDLDRIVRLQGEYCNLGESECLRCWLVRLCPICYAVCTGDGRFDAEAKRASCERVRSSFHRSLTDYCEIAEINPEVFKPMDDIVIS